MKKITITVMLLLTLFLTACGTQTSVTGTPAAEGLAAAAELALGTFKLEGTEQAVTAEQSANLLPLWQVYQSLTASDTAAQAEIELAGGADTGNDDLRPDSSHCCSEPDAAGCYDSYGRAEHR